MTWKKVVKIEIAGRASQEEELCKGNFNQMAIIVYRTACKTDLIKATCSRYSSYFLQTQANYIHQDLTLKAAKQQGLNCQFSFKTKYVTFLIVEE